MRSNRTGSIGRTQPRAYVTPETEGWILVYDLTNLLGMPGAAAGLGYTYVNKGGTPEGIDRKALRRTPVG